MDDHFIGRRLPDKWWDKIMDRTRAVIHKRTCQDCGFSYPTAEIPVYDKWKGGKADCCPVHKGYPSTTVAQYSIRQLMRGKQHSPAADKIAFYGGYYRRRKCEAKVSCETFVNEEGQYRSRKPCDIRWTTAEFSSDGVIVDDVKKCPRCESYSTRCKRRTRNRLRQGR